MTSPTLPPAVAFGGLLYRALNPVYAREPLSGEGARRHGGRFNTRGTPALYLALSPATALREANQVGMLQPTTLVAYRADLAGLLDGRDAAVLASLGTTSGDLADPDWRHRMLTGAPVPTQDLALRLTASGHAGLIVPSYARGATARDVNLVLWRWNTGRGDALKVVDDEGRLGSL
ncbi:RES domain-containing protein [uncultured Jannaschia sp.]|uniref:RES family NAD+ phosphorylase n=1 Tax=uncultured Jannaschia sp. TaxID=293347 RepID=UPI002623E3B7|nr:RES domain-containing protein [uncultured Jannaschia sp.]